MKHNEWAYIRLILRHRYVVYHCHKDDGNHRNFDHQHILMDTAMQGNACANINVMQLISEIVSPKTDENCNIYHWYEKQNPRWYTLAVACTWLLMNMLEVANRGIFHDVHCKKLIMIFMNVFGQLIGPWGLGGRFEYVLSGWNLKHFQGYSHQNDVTVLHVG